MKTKEQLLNEISMRMNSNNSYYSSEHCKYHLALVHSAISRMESDDVDLIQVLNDGMEWQIIDLFIDCYDLMDFTKWLVDHDFDVFVDYRFSDRYYREDYSEEEWEDMVDDCLFSNENVCVKSW